MAKPIIFSDRKVSDFLFKKRSNSSFGNRSDDCIRLNTNGSIFFACMLIDKKIVVAARDLNKVIETLYLQKLGAPIRKVSSYAHVWSTHQRERNILDACYQRFKTDKCV